MDAIRAAFESQFGTEWSVPVKNSDVAESDPSDNENTGDRAADQGDEDEYGLSNSEEDEDEGPVTVKHTEEASNQQPHTTSNQRRKFMSSAAPKDDSQLISNSISSGVEGSEDLKNDLALQRLIEESHILADPSNQQKFSGADISSAGDPLEKIGGSRIKVMEARLAKAGAKSKGQRMPQAMAVGIRDKNFARKEKYRTEAREAGIVIAKDRHVKNKKTFRDRGLKINSVGRASEHGIHLSEAEIARFTGKNKNAKHGKRRR